MPNYLTRSIALLVLSIAGVAAPLSVDAAGNQTTADSDSGSGTVTVVASSVPVVYSGSGGSRCGWTWLTVGDLIGWGGQPPVDGDSQPDLGAKAVKIINGVEHRLYVVSCPDQTTFRYVPAGIQAADLIGAVRDRADELIEVPVPDVNPSAAVGGIVNLGLWLAVTPVTIDPITAEAGPAWITVTPRHVSTSFDFGNGDAVTCVGAGTPIVDLSTVEQGPCGYTYLRRSADDDPYQLSITSTWELAYTSSGGAGVLAPLLRTVTVDYDVDEIQTVGTSG
jgi:hypothetical protein